MEDDWELVSGDALEADALPPAATCAAEASEEPMPLAATAPPEDAAAEPAPSVSEEPAAVPAAAAVAAPLPPAPPPPAPAPAPPAASPPAVRADTPSSPAAASTAPSACVYALFLWCLLSVLTQSGVTPTLRAAAPHFAGAPTAHAAPPHAPVTPVPADTCASPLHNATAAADLYAATTTAPPPSPPHQPPAPVPLPCALCVTEEDASACGACDVVPFARHGAALAERRALARLSDAKRHRHRRRGGGAAHGGG
jgi:hypothetical protein